MDGLARGLIAVIEGVRTSIPLHRELLHQPDVLSGDYSIKWLEDWLKTRG